MNQLEVTILEIQETERLHILKCTIGDKVIHMLTLELDPEIKIGKNVNISIKSTNIGISKTLKKDISIENQIKSKVIHIENGEILSSISLNIEGVQFEAIITLKASKRLNLKLNDHIFALMPESDIFIVI